MQSFKNLFTKQNVLFFLVVILLINLFYLDYIIYQNGGIKSEIKTIYQTNSQNPVILPTAALSITSTPTLKPVSQANTNLNQSNTKEYYVPFGSGSVSSTDWQDVPGIQAYIDSTSYGNISQVVFEASLHIPTGNEIASVRLINATDGRVISGSQLDFNGNTSSTLLSSGSVNLDYANKLYKIQIKTQLGYEAILDQARVHIVAK